MRDVVILFVHLIVTVVRFALPGGLRFVVAESSLVKRELLILNRGRKRAPNLRAAERIIAGLCALFMSPARLLRSAIVLKPSTLPLSKEACHRAEVKSNFAAKSRAETIFVVSWLPSASSSLSPVTRNSAWPASASASR